MRIENTQTSLNKRSTVIQLTEILPPAGLSMSFTIFPHAPNGKAFLQLLLSPGISDLIVLNPLDSELLTNIE